MGVVPTPIHSHIEYICLTSCFVPACQSRLSVSMYNICSLLIIQMRIVDFADMLQGSINEKIKECKDSIHKLHNPIYNKSLEVEIDRLEWVQG